MSLISSLIDLFGFCRNRSTSSAYRLILCVNLLVRMPVMLFWYIAAASGSMKSANSEGEGGHPCLVPLWSVKFCEVSHDCCPWCVVECLDLLNKYLSKAKFFQGFYVFIRNVQFTLSNAFLASNERMIVLRLL